MESDSETLVDNPIETEELALSDTEGATSKEEEALFIPVNIDYGNRVVLADKTFGSYSSSRSNLPPLYESENNFSAYHSSNQDELQDTSCEEYELSDVEGQSFNATRKKEATSLRSFGSKHHTVEASSFNNSSTTFKINSKNDLNGFDENGLVTKLTGGLSVVGFPSTLSDAFSGTNDKLSPFTRAALSGGVQMKNNSFKSSLMTCMEFLKADVSEGEGTDVEEMALDVPYGEGTTVFPVQKLSEISLRSGHQNSSDSVLRNRGKRNDLLPPENRGRKSSWTTEMITDDDGADSENSSPERDQITMYKRNKKRLSNTDDCSNDCLTDEEVFDAEKGDEAALGNDDLVSTTTTTTTRVVTSLTADSDLLSDVESSFVQQLSGDDIRQSCEVSISETHDNRRGESDFYE